MDLPGCSEHGRAAGLSTWSTLPKGVVGACKRLLEVGAGLRFGLCLRAPGARGADPSLRELLVAASLFPAALSICMLIFILHLCFALLWPPKAGLNFLGSKVFQWGGTWSFHRWGADCMDVSQIARFSAGTGFLPLWWPPRPIPYKHSRRCTAPGHHAGAVLVKGCGHVAQSRSSQAAAAPVALGRAGFFC